MSLRMPGPWKHPDTGIYYLRQRRPKEFASTQIEEPVAIPVAETIRFVKVGAMVKVSLATKNREEAKARYREADAALQEFWQRYRASPQPLTQKQIQALAGLLYYQLVGMMDSEPGEEGIWTAALRLNQGKMERGELDGWFGPSVDELFAREGVRTDPLSRTRVVHAAFGAIQRAAEVNQRKAQGDYTPDEGAKRFPVWESSGEVAARTTASASAGKFDLFVLLDHKFDTQSLDETTRKAYRGRLKKFVELIGHSDARRVTKDDVRRWRDKLIAEGRPPKTINDNYQAALSSVLSHAVDEFSLADNVAKGVRDKRSGPEPRGPKGYDADQAKTILAATFKGTAKAISAPHRRAIFWVPWMLAYTGLRVTEVTQLRGVDVRAEGDTPFLFITPAAGSTKSKKAWTMAVHPHLVELGLIDMFKAIGDGPAFYVPYPAEADLSANAASMRARAQEAGNRVAEWITDELGIPAPLDRPNRAWRHLFTSLSRVHGLDTQARNYMMGSNPKDAREGYGEWPAATLLREIKKLPRFEVEEGIYRPSTERVEPQPIRGRSAKRKVPKRHRGR
ncbi:site-specific integrase [Aminobacter anthyllidis]|uniref:Site-specific integrase n=1 Tax=Aminobacter anthyllidis TaxID=1035067 RepID=A0A9X1A9M9_9HYPH|nr:DUF6538 domain-containing protein [Aminobacter anthyllidis]MBT1155698.1 site-specific integrase [Aminobacter anthyllidis]